MEKPRDKTNEQLGSERLVEAEPLNELSVSGATGDLSSTKAADAASANVSTGSELSTPIVAPILSSHQPVVLKPSLGHSGFALISFNFALFELIFLNMFSDKFWFAVDVQWLGPLVVMLLYPLAHCILRWQESDFGCNLFSIIWKQKPPIVYLKWVSLNDTLFPPGIRFGNKHVGWSVIDEVELTLLGNLVLKSRALSGAQRSLQVPLKKFEEKLVQPQVVLKIPFGVAARDEQMMLVESIRQNNADVVFNARLEKSINAPVVKGVAMIPLLGAVFLFVVLLDVGYSTFAYLETLKGVLSRSDRGNLRK